MRACPLDCTMVNCPLAEPLTRPPIWPFRAVSTDMTQDLGQQTKPEWSWRGDGAGACRPSLISGHWRPHATVWQAAADNPMDCTG